MSFSSIKITLKSSSLKGDPKSFETRIRQIMNKSIRRGTRNALNFFLPFVALRTGAMRQSIENMVIEQITKLNRFVVNINFNISNFNVEYTKYHIKGGPEFNPKFSSGYKNPTIKGTKPIDPNELIRLLKKHIKRQVNKSIRKEGFRFRFKARKIIFIQ